MRYSCLVLDHDDTVVKSSPQIHYPAFIEAMRLLRPERAGMSFDEFIACSCEPGILQFMTGVLRLDEREMRLEQEIWRRYTAEKTPEAYEGFAALFANFRAHGGRVCVASHSERGVIARHYQTLFGFAPDLIFGWDLPERMRKPFAYPLEETMRRLGPDRREILVVDDLIPGLEMAERCGVDFAYARWSHTAGAVERFMRPRVRLAFAGVGELERFLEIS